MKRALIIYLCLAISIHLQANTWIQYGPGGIHANNVCFSVDLQQRTAICTDDGFYLTDAMGQNWTHYTDMLPVCGATYLDGQNILIAMGCGTFSDGIYSFDAGTGQFTVVEWCFKPHFIIRDDANQKYFAGWEGGLLSSSDGTMWTDVPSFDSRNCKAMGIYGNNYVITYSDTSSYHVALSADAGINWSLSVNAPPLEDIYFAPGGKLYAIFPGASNSSGLWSSVDYGMNWNFVFFDDNCRSVGLDMANHLFVGWDSTATANPGIAWYNLATQSFLYINTGLASKQINRIKVNPILSAIIIFCCTNSGVYMMNSAVITDDGNDLSQAGAVQIFPNPASGLLYIGQTGFARFSIINKQGKIIKEGRLVRGISPVGIDDIVPGMYFVRLENNAGTITCRKMIVF